MNVCVHRLGAIVATRIDNEAVVRVNVPVVSSVTFFGDAHLEALYSPRLIRGVVPASQTPGLVPPLSSPATMAKLMCMRLRPGWKGEVHQVRDALLSASTIWILHTGHLSLCILIHESVRRLAL